MEARHVTDRTRTTIAVIILVIIGVAASGAAKFSIGHQTVLMPGPVKIVRQRGGETK